MTIEICYNSNMSSDHLKVGGTYISTNNPTSKFIILYSNTSSYLITQHFRTFSGTYWDNKSTFTNNYILNVKR